MNEEDLTDAVFTDLISLGCAKKFAHLKNVVPLDRGSFEIGFSMGVSWITEVYQRSLAHGKEGMTDEELKKYLLGEEAPNA